MGISPRPEGKYSSAILTAQHGSGEERIQAVEHIIATHWKPLYKYLRFRYGRSPEDAQGIIAGFLDEVPKQGFFSKFDSQSGPPRVFLRKELDRYVGQWRGSHSILHPLPIDYAAAEGEYRIEVHFAGIAADDYYEGEWVRHLFTLAVGELQATLAAEGKSDLFDIFLRSDLQQKTGSERTLLDGVAREAGISINDAMNAIASARQQFHRILKEIVQSLTTSESEFNREMQTIFKK